MVYLYLLERISKLVYIILWDISTHTQVRFIIGSLYHIELYRSMLLLLVISLYTSTTAAGRLYFKCLILYSFFSFLCLGPTFFCHDVQYIDLYINAKRFMTWTKVIGFEKWRSCCWFPTLSLRYPNIYLYTARLFYCI